MAVGTQDIVTDVIFDYQTVAEQVRQYRKKRKLPTPSVANLATAMTSMEITDTVFGASSLTIDIVDRNWELIEFFSIDSNGHIGSIDINYPLDSENWWRLTRIDLSGGVDGERFTLTFIERPIAWLLHKHGPEKASRGKMTRAQFLQSLVKKVKAGQGLRFVSHELKKRQPIVGARGPSTQSTNGSRLLAADPDPVDIPVAFGGPSVAPNTPQKPDEKKKKENKDPGFPPDTHIKWEGKNLSKEQLDQIDICLNVADQEGASDLAVKAMLCAGLGESDFDPRQIATVYKGVFQSNQVPQFDTEKQCHYFLLGGKGFQGGGAIDQAKRFPDKSPGLIAADVEASYPNQFLPSAEAAQRYYEKGLSTAEEILQVWGPGGGTSFSGGTSYYRQQFNFQIGTEEEPNETYWDGMVRLAEDVRWRLFCTGRTIYFDSDFTLIRQRPYVLNREDPAVLRYTATWDERRIATGMELDIICEPFIYRAGDCFLLDGFGPLSEGSTSKPPQPGRWLITDISRNSGNVYSSFTLAQPQQPKREPRADIGERSVEDEEQSAGVGDLTSNMTPKEVIDSLVVPIARKHGLTNCAGQPISPEGVESCNASHGHTVSGGTSDHEGPPNIAWAADMSNGGSTVPDKQKDACADELARAFGFKVAQDYVYPFNQAPTSKGFRFQLGYRTNVGGNHFNHVHFGVRRIITSSPSRPDTAGNPNVSS